MESKIISMPGNSKAELLKKLEQLEQKHADTIKSNDVNFVKENGQYKIKAKKLWYHFDGVLTVDDNAVTIEYDTNAPDMFVKDGLNKFTEELKNI